MMSTGGSNPGTMLRHTHTVQDKCSGAHPLSGQGQRLDASLEEGQGLTTRGHWAPGDSPLLWRPKGKHYHPTPRWGLG